MTQRIRDITKLPTYILILPLTNILYKFIGLDQDDATVTSYNWADLLKKHNVENLRYNIIYIYIYIYTHTLLKKKSKLANRYVF